MHNTQRIPVALVDDHTLFRSILADVINGIEGYEVVLEAGDGQQFIEAVRAAPPIAVAIVDLHMPVMDGYETIAWIRAHSPQTRALALTFEKTEMAMVRALRAGACGFLLKDVHKSVFKDALDRVATLGHYHDEELAHVLSLNGHAEHNGHIRTLNDLTDREAEFLRHICHADEHTYERIADLMKVSIRTVDGYRESIFHKYGIKSKAGLVLFALKRGVAQL